MTIAMGARAPEKRAAAPAAPSITGGAANPPQTGERSNIIAICYDYDGTLSPGNLQENKFLPDIGRSPQNFWNEVNSLSASMFIDPTIAYMRVMLTSAAKAGVRVTRESLAEWGRAQSHFPGATDWFARQRRYAAAAGLDLRHYVISSGNAEIIEASAIAAELDGVFASRFYFDESGAAEGPAIALNFTTKTQFIYRINKGAQSPSHRDKINEYLPDAERPVPFSHIIYIGDGETDVPCFRLTSSLGGLAIAVYDKCRQAAAQFLRQERVAAIAPADYRRGSPLDAIVRARIDVVAAERQLALAVNAANQ